MIVNIVIGAIIFGYSGWALVRFINKSKKGKCAACELKNCCSNQCENPVNKQDGKKLL